VLGAQRQDVRRVTAVEQRVAVLDKRGPTVPERLADGDPWAGIDDQHYSLEPLLRLWEEQGAVELNYPPDYPKMPGEPPRVQPSKKVAAHWDDQGNRVPD